MISNYDYHFIIKELAEEFEGQFICLRKNTEKYITFSVPIAKEVTRIDKKGKVITKTISYRSQFIDSAKFMASSLTNLVSNLVVRIHKIKCKYSTIIKNVKLVELNTKTATATSIKNNRIQMFML